MITNGIINLNQAFRLTFTNASEGSNMLVGDNKNMIFIPYK